MAKFFTSLVAASALASFAACGKKATTTKPVSVTVVK